MRTLNPRRYRGGGRHSGGVAARPGVTLVEMLVVMLISLIIIFAMVQAFESVSRSISEQRATTELSSQKRMVTHRLRADLQSVTVPIRPWADPRSGSGYFEIFDGPGHDWDGDGTWTAYPATGWENLVGVSAPPTGSASSTVPQVPSTVLGDPDDLIAMTVRSSGEPFRGRHVTPAGVAIVESQEAEVVWWTAVHDINRNNVFDADDRLILFRRALLIRPDLALAPLAGPRDPVWKHYLHSDISARPSPTAPNGRPRQMIANSLDDLSKRENRFLHEPETRLEDRTSPVRSETFPHRNHLVPRFVGNAPSLRALVGMPDFVTDDMLVSYQTDPTDPSSPRIQLSQYVIASNVLAFDVKVFDPSAPIFAVDGEPVAPGDPGFITLARGGSSPVPVGRGAFVDLGYMARIGGDPTISVFSGVPHVRSGLSVPIAYGATYDTWSTHYEYDGLDQDFLIDRDGLIDEGSNGFDDDGQFGPDDHLERETSPPYPVPLRGVEVTLRLTEPGTRQVSQGTVVVDFVPE